MHLERMHVVAGLGLLRTMRQLGIVEAVRGVARRAKAVGASSVAAGYGRAARNSVRCVSGRLRRRFITAADWVRSSQMQIS